jgi:hypothetical protein
MLGFAALTFPQIDVKVRLGALPTTVASDREFVDAIIRGRN